MWASRSHISLSGFLPDARPTDVLETWHWESASISQRDLWKFYAIAFPFKHVVEDFAARHIACSPRSGENTFDWNFFQASFPLTPLSIPRERGARGEQLEDWLFDLVIRDRRYKPDMRKALRLRLVDGWKITNAANKCGVKPGTLKKAAHELRRAAAVLHPLYGTRFDLPPGGVEEANLPPTDTPIGDPIEYLWEPPEDEPSEWGDQ